MRNLFSQDKWKYLSIALIGVLATSMLSVAFQLPQLVQETIGLQPAYGAGAMTNVFVMPSDNVFRSESYYVVAFTTATTGTLKTITMTFPSGFVLTNAKLIEVQNIGAGSIGISGQTITYTVNSAVSVPAGTAIKIMIGKIVNAATTSNTVAVTTKNATPATIDGPTNSATFTLIQVTNSMIGTSAVSNSKIQSGAVTSSKIGSGVQLTGNVCLDSPTICVDSVNDRVGIATTTPQGKLSIMNGDVLIGTIPYLPYVDSHSLWLTNDNGDPNNSFRIDPANNALYIIGDSAPGATAGTSIVFRTAQAGNGESDVVTLNNGDMLIGNVPNRAAPGSNSLYLTNDGGDQKNTFRIDASNDALNIVGNSAPGSSSGTSMNFKTSPPGGGEFYTRLVITPNGEFQVYGPINNFSSASFGNPGEPVSVRGPLFLTQSQFANNSIVLRSPDTTCHEIHVDDSGVLSTTAVTCP